ncbi:MAG: CRISPR-associated protein Csx11 [Candidatus Methanoperedens sp.]
MSDLIQAIKDKREDILIGEIGALLHDIGKCHPDFVKSKSIEKTAKDTHAQIDNLLNSKLVSLIKNIKFNIYFKQGQTDIYSLITEHHNHGTKDKLVTLLESCDRLDSADDKGIIRKKQSIDNTVINSPFGYPKEKIDLNCLQNRLDDLSNNLIGLFENYISNSIALAYVRESAINNLETAFIHALGETRIPSNDATLWDHSHSTASLFKSILCSLTLGEYPQKLQWRVLGFCWDGTGFINKGKKIADILKRNEIIEDIKSKLKNKFEDEIPIGNEIYEDTNGIYFTFPELENNQSVQLAKECAKIGLEIIRKESDNEIWPFFTLSNPSRTLTIIAGELKFSMENRKIPKMIPTLFVECTPEGEILVNNLELPVSKGERDICPVCQFRSKPVNSESCEICEKRRKGRMDSWLSNSLNTNTIWIDEVADRNNRIALLTLSFDLDKWLGGTMVGTIYSQSFEDWRNSKDANKFFKNNQNIQRLNKKGVKIDDTLIDLSKNGLKIITDEDISKDIGFKSDLINTFFEDLRSSQNLNDENYFEKFVENLKLRLESEPFNSSNLQRLLFTQNPSPARLYRIWKETEDFFDLIFREIKDNTYSTKWKRIKFSIDISSLHLKSGKKIEKDTPYLIKIEGLEPENLLVFHSSNGGFCTIESLEKLKLNNKNEIEAIEYGLKDKGFYHLAYEDKTDENLLANAQPVKISNIETEKYYPFIEITKSPLSLRLILPALDSIKILELVTKLYDERFKKVIGKLPLNTGLLVSKRKFPLYVLLDAGERMLNEKDFKGSEEMDPWWDITELTNDNYYGFYPTKKLNGDGKYYILDELASLSKGKHFALASGYFDFDILLATTERYKINYEGKKRIDENYRLLSSRPYYFYQIPQMIDLWEILYNNISSSQINFIEEIFMRKLIEWKAIPDPDNRVVFKDFVVATLKDAFAKKWGELKVETQDFLINSVLNRLLLDTIILFRHTIKVKEVNENE